MSRVWRSGAGAVVTKSLGKEPKKGYSGPNIVQTPCGLLNAMGLSNPGVDVMVEEIEGAKENGCTVIGSIFGGTAEDYEDLTSRMEEAGVDAVELNLSCPHAEGLSTIGRDPDLTEEIVEACSKFSVPIWAKLPGNTHIPNLLEVADSATDGGADALVVTNTLPSMAIDAETEKPILGNRKGGLSGPAMKPVGIRLVYEVYEQTDAPVVGAGGVTNGEDVIEYMLAGASAVQIGTGVMDRDIDIFRKVTEEAAEFLEGREFGEIVGNAHDS
jgi:dihydroorotate dehydrogenase (NAD+) catalytic subunit